MNENIDVQEKFNENLEDKKILLINVVSASLIAEPKFNADDPTSVLITELVRDISSKDPEFILKLALYTRQDLNIRSTANFLLALSSNDTNCQPFLKKYYGECIRLPSDWLDVAALYMMLPNKTLNSTALPNALRKVMAAKFSDFDTYQLGKYNNIGKIKRMKKKLKKIEVKGQQIKEKKSKPTLTMKQMIRQLHISYPPNAIMCILGKKYPLDESEFRLLKLPGRFEAERAGKRMKLPVPETWETFLSAKGNKAETWEELIDNRKLPFMAMLRNLRNLIITGVSFKHHRWVISKLTDEKTVANSRQFPFAFFSAYEAVKIDLEKLKEQVKAEKERISNARQNKVVTGGKPLSDENLESESLKLQEKMELASESSVPVREERPVRRGRDQPVKRGRDQPVKRGRGEVPPQMGRGQVGRGRAPPFGRGITPTPMGRGRGRGRGEIKEIRGERRGGGRGEIRRGGEIRERDDKKEPEVEIEEKESGEEEKRREKKVIIPKRMPDQAIIEKYQAALDTAVKFATIHNVKPIRGSTVVFCSISESMKNNCKTAKGLGAVSKLDEVGILLGLMCKYMCEECDFRIFSSPGTTEKCHLPVELEEGTILDNMRIVLEKSKSGELGGEQHFPFDYFEDLIKEKKKIDNIIILSDNFIAPGENDNFPGGENFGGVNGILEKYRQEINNDLLYVSVNLKGMKNVGNSGKKQHPNNVLISGFSAAILRYIAERGDGNQLQSIDTIDQAYGIDQKTQKENKNEPLLTTKERKRRQKRVNDQAEKNEKEQQLIKNTVKQKMEEARSGKWRNARVFVSSTFLDMHGERDLLVKYVFPELKKRCLGRKVNFYGVDLRWGLTSEETNQALSICLNEVERCRPFFIGFLGGRYGWVPDNYESVPDEPQFDWLKSAPSGRSITELEMMHGALREPNESECFFYLRESSFEQEKVPQQYKNLFVEASEANKQKLEKLKDKIRQEIPQERVFQYSAEWGGVNEAKPMATNLQKLQQKITDDLWEAIQRVFPEEVEERKPLQVEFDLHHSLIQSRSLNFVGRRAELQMLYDFALQDQSSQVASPFVVYGTPGDGKSSLLSQFVQTFENVHKNAVKKKSNNEKDLNKSKETSWILYHFVGSSPNSRDIRSTLYRLCSELKNHLHLNSLEVPEEYKELKQAFPRFLQEASFASSSSSIKTVIVIDSLNQFYKTDRAHSLDWLPGNSPIPIIVSTYAEHSTMQALSHRKPALPMLQLEPLSKNERMQLVRNTLMRYRKKLDERPSNNQMRYLMTKPDSTKPLFLVTACEELRVFGVYEKLTHYIKSMSPTIDRLFVQVLERLENEYGEKLVRLALSTMATSRGGLYEEEIKQILAEELAEEDEEETILPESKWSAFYNALLHFLIPTNDNGEGTLEFFHNQMISIVKKRYLSIKENSIQTHKLLANYFLKKVDPNNDFSLVSVAPQSMLEWGLAPKNLTLDVVRAFSELPHHLINAKLWRQLEGTLLSYKFIFYKCQMGMVYQLLADLNEATQVIENQKSSDILLKKSLEVPDSVVTKTKDFLQFLSSNAHIIVEHPNLFLQQACNEPSFSSVCQQAHEESEKAKKERHLLFKKIKARRGGNKEANDKHALVWLEWNNKPKKQRPCKMTLSGYAEAILSCAFSPSGKYMVASSRDRTLRIFNARTGEEKMVLTGHSSWVVDCQYSPNGKQIVSASWDGTVKIWDAKVGTEIATLKEHTKRVSSCCFSQNGLMIASGSWDCSVIIWDSVTGKPITTLKGHKKPVNACCFSPDNSQIVSASWDATLILWDIESGNQLKEFKGHTKSIRNVSFAPTGRQIVSTSVDCTTKVWDINSGSNISTLIGHSKPVNRATFSNDGKHLVTASEDNTVRVWDALGGRPISILSRPSVSGHSTFVNSCTYSNDGKKMCTSSGDCCVVIWDSYTERQLFSLSGHTRTVNRVVFSPNSKQIASVSDDCTIRIWDAVHGKLVKVIEGHTNSVNDCSFSPDGKNIITVSDDNYGYVWDISNGQKVFELKGHTGMVNGCSWSPKGDLLATVSRDNTIRIWDAFNGQCKKVLRGHLDWITRVEFFPDGKKLLTASWDFNTKIWNIKKGKEITTLVGHQGAVSSAHVSPTGNQILTASFDGTLKLWDKDGGLITTIDGHGKRVNDCAYSPDGKIVLSASDDGSLRMWDAVAGTQVSSLEGHSAPINGATFSPKSSEIVSASHDGSLRFWDTTNFTEKKTKKIEETKKEDEEIVEKEDKKEEKVEEIDIEDDPTSWFNKNSSNTTWINCVVFNSKGNKLLTAARDGEITLWDIESGTRSLKLRGGHTQSVNSVAYNNNDQLIASVSDDCSVILWNKDGQLLEKMQEHKNSIRSVSFHPNESDTFVTAAWDCTVRVWNKRGLQKTLNGHKDWVNHAQYHPNGKLIVSGSHDRSFILWDSQTGNKLNQYHVHDNWIQHLSFNHDGTQLLTSCFDSKVKSFEIKDNQAIEQFTLENHSKRVNCSKFVLPNSKFIVSVSNDNTIVVSNSSGEQVSKFFTVAPATSLDISKKGEVACVDSNGNIYVLTLHQI